MALTLVEAAKLHDGEDVRSAVIQLFAMSSDILRVMPFDDIEGGSLTYNQEDTLPGVAFRGVNGSYTESTGVINPVVEKLVIAGGDLDVDLAILKMLGQDQRAVQEAMKVKALAHKIGYTIIKGDSATTAKEFDGLQVRLTGNQLVAAGSTANGDALSLAKLDQLIDAVDSPTHLIMSKAMRRLLTAAARTTTVGGYITYSQDEFGRRISMYNELPILLADANSDLYSTLAFNEACPGGGTSTGTSIYCVSFGEGMYQGIQNGVMEVRDLGELQTKPSMRTRVEWLVAQTLWHPRAAARLWGISNATVTV